MATQLAFFNQYLAFGYAELFGEKFHQVGIGLAINGRGGNGDFKLVAMYAHDAIAAGLRLNIQPEHQPLSAGFNGTHSAIHSPGSSTLPVACSTSATPILITYSSSTSTIGEKSIPPIDGSRLRIGRSSGSASCISTYSTGLRPWLTQLMIAINSSTQKINEPMVFSRISRAEIQMIGWKVITINSTIALMTQRINATSSEALSIGPIAGIIRRSGPTIGWVAFTTNCENGL